MAPASSKPLSAPPSSVSTTTTVKAVRAVKPLISAPAPSSTAEPKWVYVFGEGTADGRADMRALLGGKGANLAEMSHLGLPVPPGFTLTTAVCRYFNSHAGGYPSGLEGSLKSALTQLEARTGRVFGGADSPLLLSVRSGAAVSMPGMMDTVLNLGLNDLTVQGLCGGTGGGRFAYDSYRRFLQMFGNVVQGISMSKFDDVLSARKQLAGVSLDTGLTETDLRAVVTSYKAVIRDETGTDFPQDPLAQLRLAIGAVFNSWGNDRAVVYRRLHGIADALGTAVTVQAMVFGNQGDDCATGVAFSRDPATGENVFFGEYLANAQGEDVVAGIRTPHQLTLAGKAAQASTLPAMEETMPVLFKQLVGVKDTLEHHFRDMQDIEFTVERGKLYLLQTRNAKRAARAAVRAAVEMAESGLISQKDAVRRVSPAVIPQLLHRALSPKAEKSATLLCTGLPASPGAASGRAVFCAEDVGPKGECILVRAETSPDDVAGMALAAGVLTARGGMTSHAAVVARGMGVSCVVGASAVSLHESEGKVYAEIGGVVVKQGDVITIDGASGKVYAGRLATQAPAIGAHFHKLLDWADKFATLTVQANAETPVDVAKARELGARGVGLARTEHMFFNRERITAVRAMILARDDEQREKSLAILTPMQRGDFRSILDIMHGFPVTVRLLDPPLHEFLPHVPAGEDECAELTEVAKLLGDDADGTKSVTARTKKLAEANPMLGLRGCRVGVLYPGVYAMQARAALQAAADVAAEKLKLKESEGETETGATFVPVQLNIMVPFISTAAELTVVRKMVDDVAAEIFDNVDVELDTHVRYEVGTMIELPRAALRAGDIAKEAQFFSFGTNDLTQTTFGLSRDDAGAFLPAYQERGILPADPFVSLDTEGVGELIEIAVERGTKARSSLKTCLCGEQGADAASVAFCHRAGLHSVSCSPYAVPVARLAAAHAALEDEGK